MMRSPTSIDVYLVPSHHLYITIRGNPHSEGKFKTVRLPTAESEAELREADRIVTGHFGIHKRGLWALGEV
jgi:hypothetical protein